MTDSHAKLPEITDDSPLPMKLASGFLNKCEDMVKIKADRESNKIAGFVIWNNGQWTRYTEDGIINALTKLFVVAHPKVAKVTTNVNEAYKILVAHIETTYEMDWDRSVASLPLADGNRSLCLKTGDIIDTPKDHRMVRRLAVSEAEIGDADAYDRSAFKAFLEEWLDDPERRHFAQLAMAQGLIGNPTSTIMDCWGTGRNGKGALFEYLRQCVGEFCASLSTNYFTPGPSRHEAGQVKLKFARFAVIGEFEAGQRIDTGLLKGLAAGDPLDVSRKGKDPFEISAQCLFIIHGNADLQIKDKSKGIQDRWKTLKFLNYFPDDSRLGKDDMADLARTERGIFAHWLIEGIKEFRANGNKYADIGTVVDDTKEKFVGENPIQQLMAQFCVEIPNSKLPVKELFSIANLLDECAWKDTRGLTRGLNETGYTIGHKNRNKVPEIMGYMLIKDALKDGLVKYDGDELVHVKGDDGATEPTKVVQMSDYRNEKVPAPKPLPKKERTPVAQTENQSMAAGVLSSLNQGE